MISKGAAASPGPRRPPQQLPVPVASHPRERYQPRRWRHSWKPPSWPLLMICAGLGAAVAGAALAALPPPVTVGLDRGGYQLGSVRLLAVGTGSYSSAKASLVIKQVDAETVAGSSSQFNGQPMTGRCVVEAAGGREHCSLAIGSERLAAEDVRTRAGWHRRYSDGRELDVTTLGRDAIPVPFPVGR